VGAQSYAGVWLEPSRPRKLKPKSTGRPPSALHYGKGARRCASLAKAAKLIPRQLERHGLRETVRANRGSQSIAVVNVVRSDLLAGLAFLHRLGQRRAE